MTGKGWTKATTKATYPKFAYYGNQVCGKSFSLSLSLYIYIV